MMSFYSSAGLCHDAGKGKVFTPVNLEGLDNLTDEQLEAANGNLGARLCALAQTGRIDKASFNEMINTIFGNDEATAVSAADDQDDASRDQP